MKNAKMIPEHVTIGAGTLHWVYKIIMKNIHDIKWVSISVKMFNIWQVSLGANLSLSLCEHTKAESMFPIDAILKKELIQYVC
jgi:hypothetical protein